MSRIRSRSIKLFWSIRKDKDGMINKSIPINFISYTDKVMRREIVELHKSPHVKLESTETF